MSKRKRDIVSRDTSFNDTNDSDILAQQEQLKNSLEHSKKSLFRALKLARGFERQKLGRRQKTAKESIADGETIKRLNAEISALKALDLVAIAELHIYKSMIKAKPVLSAPGFPQYIVAKVKSATPSHDSAQNNVQARLFSSDAVKMAMTSIMAGIGAALGIQEDNALFKRKKRLRASDYAAANIASKNNIAHIGSLASEEQLESRLEGQSLSEKEPVIDIMSKISEDPANFRISASELADSSSYESAGGDYSRESSAGVNKIKYSPPNEHFFPSSQLPNFSAPMSTEIHPRKNPVPVPKSTTFIPSLTMGGYISDSDSAASLASNHENTKIKPRNNRRGQHERRQIWEKKFGTNANHVKRQLQSQSRDQGWDIRSGARGSDGKRQYGKGKRQDPINSSIGQRGRGPMSSGANSDPVGAREKTNRKGGNDKPLHPSWEAAKKVKEAKKNVAFEGKKVVFS